MTDDNTRGTLSRRTCLKTGGALLAGGLLAGCAGNATQSNESSEKSADTTQKDSYSVAMSPVGEVAFEGVPESAFVVNAQYADMAVAFGHGDAVNSLFSPKFLGKTMNNYYDRLNISFDWKGLPDPLSGGLSKELVYKLSSDVHFADPVMVTATQKGWEKSDIEEIRTNIAPWFGNYYSGPHSKPPKDYSGKYQYYSLWELTEKVARVFKAHDRYKALEAIHAEMLSTIHSKLPPKDERPTAARVTLGDGEFYTYHLNEPGFWMADTRPLRATDAFAGETWSGQWGWGTVGYEAMLEADPDVILHLWGLSPGYDIHKIVRKIKNHPVGRQLSAIRNDRFYASGIRRQGPLVNLFQLEMTAKQLYPEKFGEWPGYDGGSYPKIPENERLFDRKRVAGIVNGRNLD
ncbi:MAG TPA: ABC transporter substrate-binding protein [Halococcus sp.]|nr:ABC transporter substrate-binding protein [Halococcus sp.]